MMEAYTVYLLLFAVLAAAQEVYLNASVHGPGHHKGLYGITRKKPKTADTSKSSSTKAGTSSNSTLKSVGNTRKANVGQKIVKRSSGKSNSSDLPTVVQSKRTGVELLGGVIKPVSVKEVKVGYTKSIDEKDPNNASQVFEITGNMTNSKVQNDSSESNVIDASGLRTESGDIAGKNEVFNASSDTTSDLNASKTSYASSIPKISEELGAVPLEKGGSNADSRSPSSNMLTDLKVPNMGQYIHGKDPDLNGSSGAADISNQQPPENATQAQGNNDATSRSPQVSNLGASIVGIVDNSNNSQAKNSAMYSQTANISKNEDGLKLKAFLADLDEIANSTAETAKLVNSTVQEFRSPAFLQNRTWSNATSSSIPADVNANKKHEIVGPHYFEPECDDKKKCPDGHYCRMYVCVECHRSKHACTHREQCCKSMECVYGRCETKAKGSPGAFCEKDNECAGEACCVLEPTVDEEHSICKPKLSEYHQCSPILFRKIWIGDNKPDCGPCKGGLTCTQRGVEGSHEVCMKKP